MTNTVTFRITPDEPYSLSPLYASKLATIYTPTSWDENANAMDIDLEAQICKTYIADDVRGYTRLSARTHRLLESLPTSRLYMVLDNDDPIQAKHYLIVPWDGSAVDSYVYTSFCPALEDILDRKAIEIDLASEDFILEES